MKGPEQLITERLLLRKPRPDDADAIYARYASDPEVTRYLSWPRHRTLAATQKFLAFCEVQWQETPCGPYVIETREDRTLLGSTGLAFEVPDVASTGYVLARDAWGRGYATEALRAMVAVGETLEVRHLYALCHPANVASVRVLKRCGFERQGVLARYGPFPNDDDEEPQDVLCYLRPAAMSAFVAQERNLPERP